MLWQELPVPPLQEQRQPCPRAAGGIELIGIGAHLTLDIVGDLGVIAQELLGVVAALTQADIAVVEPCAALLNDAQLDTQIDELTHLGDALAEHDVKLSLTERREPPCS